MIYTQSFPTPPKQSLTTFCWNWKFEFTIYLPFGFCRFQGFWFEFMIYQHYKKSQVDYKLTFFPRKVWVHDLPRLFGINICLVVPLLLFVLKKCFAFRRFRVIFGLHSNLTLPLFVIDLCVLFLLFLVWFWKVKGDVGNEERRKTRV